MTKVIFQSEDELFEHYLEEMDEWRFYVDMNLRKRGTHLYLILASEKIANDVPEELHILHDIDRICEIFNQEKKYGKILVFEFVKNDYAEVTDFLTILFEVAFKEIDLKTFNRSDN
jgi:hypothetical protein